jgi:hypothetical protein
MNSKVPIIVNGSYNRYSAKTYEEDQPLISPTLINSPQHTESPWSLDTSHNRNYQTQEPRHVLPISPIFANPAYNWHPRHSLDSNSTQPNIYPLAQPQSPFNYQSHVVNLQSHYHNYSASYPQRWADKPNQREPLRVDG